MAHSEIRLGRVFLFKLQTFKCKPGISGILTVTLVPITNRKWASCLQCFHGHKISTMDDNTIDSK